MPRKSKSTTKTKSLLTNKNMLYGSTLLMIASIIAYLVKRDFKSLFLFFVVLTVCYMFEKNMIKVVLIPVVIVNLFIFLKYIFNVKEGYDNNNKQQNQNSNNNQQSGDNSNQQQSGSNNQQQSGDNSNQQQSGNNNQQTGGNAQKPDEGFASIDGQDKDVIADKLTKLIDNYDEASSKVEKSMENTKLNPSDVEAQKEIINQMKAITPVLRDSISVLKQVDMENLNKVVSGISGVVKNSPLNL